MSVRPVDAALEGVRTLRRKPKAIAAWAAFALVMLPILGVIVQIVLGPEGRAVLQGRGSSADPREILELVTHLGGAMLLLIILALAIGAVLAAGIIRSVLQPGDKRFAYLRLGKEEIQLLIVSLITWVAALLATVIPSGAVVLGTALLSGGAATWFAFLGGLAVIGLSLWIAVRLSLLGPHAFSHHHIDVRTAWIQTHGQFWRLLAMYGLVIVMTAVISIVGTITGALVGWIISLVTGYSALISASLVNIFLVPIVLTLQAVVVTSAPARAFAHLNQDEIDAGLHD
ncbi:hypothetical protein [Caulobacter sp. RHG1]|uniref:hypothetical protein n=1 Tax=Caulobacter sp. (strain RHG1) TaxID=2545762 RepID=UPI0015559674|nr:hypothetical protein [Caulobacter sp. RHG1]NQE62550.1 hypothetical protein [Caulobacter sp. RHG1]